MIKLDRFLINPDHITAIEATDTDSLVYLTGGQTLHIRGMVPDAVATVIEDAKPRPNMDSVLKSADPTKVAEATAKAIEKIADKPKAEKPAEKTDK